jgi:hypothetical protein
MKRGGDRVHDASTTPLRTSMTPLASKAARTAAPRSIATVNRLCVVDAIKEEEEADRKKAHVIAECD